MLKKTIFLVLLSLTYSFAQKSLKWKNPITSGLPVYGFKDIQLFHDDSTFYCIGTQYPIPNSETSSLKLISSSNIRNWKEHATLLELSVLPANTWYKGQIQAPEIHKVRNKFYLTFCVGNNTLRPYKKTELGIAVADKLDGPYIMLNAEKGLFECNQPTLITDKKGNTIVVYEMDGRFYYRELDLENPYSFSDATEFLGPLTLGKNYKYLDAPNITRIGDSYHLIFSQFYGGYQVKVFHMIAQNPRGPYKFISNEPLYTWLEAEASDSLKADYPSQNYFAPPTQVIFSNHLVDLNSDNYLMVYHSSEKYSEPALCIETVKMKGRRPVILNPKKPTQKL